MFPDYLVFNAPVSIADWLLNLLPGYWRSKTSLSVAYEVVRYCGGVTLAMPVHPANTAHISVTGNGCRELEAADIVTDWQAFLANMLECGAVFSRIDCAIDDKVGLLDIDIIIAACEDGRVVSRYGVIDPRPKLDAATGEVIGRGVTFGQRTSLTYVRIYDKALQQHVPGHWIRVELETRKNRAQALAKAIAKAGAEVVPPTLLGCLDFKECGQTDRRDRWNTVDWWTTFLGTTKRCRLEIAPRNVSLEKTYQWLIRSVAPSFARVHDDGMGDRLIAEMLRQGRQKAVQPKQCNTSGRLKSGEPNNQTAVPGEG